MTPGPALLARDLHKHFQRERGEIVHALDGVSFAAKRGELTALVGPDGAGKTTLIRLAAGLLTADRGSLTVLGIDVAADPQRVQSRVSYMPQRFGLYEDLSVQENLDLYADLHGVSGDQRRATFGRLMEMTNLAPFMNRLAGRLSGGMKQKLGLACTLVRAPELLLADEPTVGVDPVSRRELWAIILQLAEQGLTVLMSTSYLDEAERCANVIVLNAGRMLAEGPPAKIRDRATGRTFLATPAPPQRARELQARVLDDPRTIDAVPQGGKVRLVTAERTDPSRQIAALSGIAIQPVTPRFEDGFMILLKADRPAGEPQADAAASGEAQTRSEAPVEANVAVDDRAGPEPGASQQPRSMQSAATSGGVAVRVRDLTRMFGSFIAVDHVSFEVRAGEIFGLLGPNGAGKTTTFRMLCGLLPASSGTLTVAGVDVRHARASARQRLGYVAQKFSLYGQLTVKENLQFFAAAYGLRRTQQRRRVEWAMREFDLMRLASLASGQLPGGYKQRLAMAASLMHEPEILFLDEPTSGADPQARREFWRRITALSARGVTIIITTHFMEEAEYCDRAVIMDAGKILAEGTPAQLREHARSDPGREPDMEDAFIAIVQQARGG
jgi:ABC-2 type transport system ATP-binding protein